MSDIFFGILIIILLVFGSLGVKHLVHCNKENTVTQEMHYNTENVTMQESCDTGMCENVKCAMNTVCDINKSSQACELVQLRYATCMSKQEDKK